MAGGTQDGVVLDPSQFSTGRTELDLEGEGLMVLEADWGDADMELHLIRQAQGEVPADRHPPNRTVTLQLAVREGAVDPLPTVAQRLQQKVGLLAREGGWVRRDLNAMGSFAVSVAYRVHSATIRGFAGWQQGNRAPEIVLTCGPYCYGVTEEVLSDRVETTKKALIFTETSIKGTAPGLERITVDNDSANDWRSIIIAQESRDYSPEETALLDYEAEALTPLGEAALATRSGASGAAANNVIRHANLTGFWLAIASSEIAPAVRSVGTVANGTGAIAPALPTDWKENDIFLLFIETAGGEAVTPPAGWAHVNGSPVIEGTNTRMTVLWKRATSSESAPTVTDPGDHAVGRIIAVSGVVRTGNPWDVTATGTEATSDTSASIPTATTTVDNCLVLTAVSTGADVASTAEISGFTNANLEAITERIDNWVTDGNGGGIGVASGVKRTAGATGATTATLVTAASKALMTIALKPARLHMTHKGGRRMWVDIYDPGTTSGEVELRLEWRKRGQSTWTQNAIVPTPLVGGFARVDLGEAQLSRAVLGNDEWEWRLTARTTGTPGADIEIDAVYPLPTEQLTWARRPIETQTAESLTAYDNFDQHPDATPLSSLAATFGGNWDEAGDIDDFTTESDDGTVRRTVGNDANASSGQYVVLDGSSTLAAIEVQVDLQHPGGDFTSLTSGEIRGGVVARYVDTNNWLMAARRQRVVSGAESTELTLFKRVGGSITTLGSITLQANSHQTGTYTLKLTVDADGNAAVYTADQGVALGAAKIAIFGDSDLATGGALDDGKIGMYDACTLSGLTARIYDNFTATTETTENILPPLVEPGRSLEARSDGMFSQHATDDVWGRVEDEGMLLHAPPSGMEGRPMRTIILPSPGDLDQLPHSSTDDVSAKVRYTPAYLYASEAA